MIKIYDNDPKLSLDLDLPSYGGQGVWLFDGKPFNGIIIYINENKKIYAEEQLKDGMRNGRQLEYWENGKFKEEYFEKEGLYISSYKRWSEDGTLVFHEENDEFGNWKETIIDIE